VGLGYHEVRMLWDAKRQGMSFNHTMTIARLELYLHPAEVKKLRKEYALLLSSYGEGFLNGYVFGEYSDRFLQQLVSPDKLDILDYSPYEGATIIHDMNQPVPAGLQGRFDAIIDGGSLEHVYNIPIAFDNIRKMLKVGGTIFLSAPANNLCGHGFYQFSPELLFRVFSPANGFQIKKVALYEADYPSVELMPSRKLYSVANPADVKERVGLQTRGPVIMIAEAQKVCDVAEFGLSVLQSDYVSLWDWKRTMTPKRSLVRRLIDLLPHAARMSVRYMYRRLIGYRQKKRFSFANRRFYRKVENK
jgi:SAM-dependent methyltransferase